MDLLLHPPDDPARHRPDPRGRLSTVGHGAAFRAFARVARRAGMRFMVIGGTFRDIAVRASSTRDIDIVLVDQPGLPAEMMHAAGFTQISRSAHVWRYRAAGDHIVDVEVAAVASSTEQTGPFSVAFHHATMATIEGFEVAVPRLEDYVILKLLAAASNRRRQMRDLADVQFAIEACTGPAERTVSVSALRARLRDLYSMRGQQLKELIALIRQVHRAAKAK